nr:MAG TPA: hypothetical protein [Caudoviricetes sp.]
MLSKRLLMTSDLNSRFWQMKGRNEQLRANV